MNPSPTRFGLPFALTLALPAALAGTWAWLAHGGTIDGARRAEAAAAAQCLATAGHELDALLRAAGAASGCPLELDGERRVAGPFAAATATAVPDEAAEPEAVGIAEQAAGARLLAGDAAAALPFFALAAETDALSPEGWLRYAELRAEHDSGRASELVRSARERFGAAWIGPLPFALLAALREATWRDDPAARARLAAAALAELRRAPADTVEVAATAVVAALPELAGDARLATIRAAAAAALALAREPAPDTVTERPDGSVLVPVAGDRLAVLPADGFAAARARAAALATERHPTLLVDVAGLDRSTWSATPATTPTSRLLGYAATTSLALALVILVLGNLLLWRLTRRELALVRMRRDFVDVVSHELRTPLTALSLKAEMLAAGDVPASRREHYLAALYGDVNKLNDQVDRILAFGRLEKGAALQKEHLPARAVLARGLRAGRQALRLVGQQLEVDAPRALPALDADVEVLTRAVRNLLENAAKYAPAGSTVAVRAFADGDSVVVEIGDSGPGVPPHERRAIFEPFVRRREAAGTPGSGLGLALVAAAAKAHGGRASVRARDGGGAVFTLRLPASDSEAAS